MGMGYASWQPEALYLKTNSVWQHGGESCIQLLSESLAEKKNKKKHDKYSFIFTHRHTTGYNNGSTSLKEEIAVQPTALSATLSSCPLWVFEVDTTSIFSCSHLLPLSTSISALNHIQLYDIHLVYSQTKMHVWADLTESNLHWNSIALRGGWLWFHFFNFS